jgi:hypothetical protein
MSLPRHYWAKWPFPRIRQVGKKPAVLYYFPMQKSPQSKVLRTKHTHKTKSLNTLVFKQILPSTRLL